MGPGAGHLDATRLLLDWRTGPFAVAVAASVVVAAVSYGRAARSAPGPAWPRWRTAAWLAGLASVDLALQSPAATLTAGWFQAHVAQHLLLMLVAPPLLALGAPLTLLGRRPARARRIAAAAGCPAVRAVTHPVPAWFLYYFSMFAFFLTSALGYAMSHMWVMDLVNVAFLTAAAAFWWPLVGADPLPTNQVAGARVANLLIGVPVESFLALALYSNPRPAAAWYPPGDVRAGAVWLWLGAVAGSMLALIPVAITWARAERARGPRYGPTYLAGTAADLELARRALLGAGRKQ